MHAENVLPTPAEPWLDRLRRNHRVWLVKERRPAVVAWAWEPPEPGMRTGRIAIQQLVDNHVQAVQVWYADALGRGIDRRPLFAPLEGNLPADAAPISEPVVRDIMRQLAVMAHRIEQLETRVGRVERPLQWYGGDA